MGMNFLVCFLGRFPGMTSIFWCCGFLLIFMACFFGCVFLIFISFLVFFCNFGPAQAADFPICFSSQSYCPTWFRTAIKGYSGGKFWTGLTEKTWSGKLRGTGQRGRSIICAMVKGRYIGDGHPTFNRNPFNGYINAYYWVDDHPLLYGNNGSLDPGTYKFLRFVDVLPIEHHGSDVKLMLKKSQVGLDNKSQHGSVYDFPNFWNGTIIS